MQRKQVKPPRLYLILALVVYLCLGALPATQGFMAWDHILKPHLKRKMNNLIRRVHKEQWVIGYVYMDNCPPEARNNGQAIEEAITTSLRAWLQPVRDLNTGKPVVDDFRYVEKLEIAVADFKLYDLRIYFFCDFGESAALVRADEVRPPSIHMHRGTVVDNHFKFSLLHEIGHTFGLLDTYVRNIPGEEFQVSRGGLGRTIGHQPGSVMSGMNVPRPIASRISQDDANGIVWLYKFYHENLPLEDCIFPDYELEKSPDGCRPKYPLIFEIKHGREGLATRVIGEDDNTDVNATDGEGLTALHYAVIKGYPHLIDKLLAHQDIEVNSQDGNGFTALHYAVLQRNASAVKALLAHKDIDLEVKDKDGLTPLHYAITEKSPQLLDRLLSHEGIDVNGKDGNGLTPLHHAVMQRFRYAVEKLLAHEGIDVEVKDKDGLTPLALANQLKYQELADRISPPIEPSLVRPQNKLATVWGAIKAK